MPPKPVSAAGAILRVKNKIQTNSNFFKLASIVNREQEEEIPDKIVGTYTHDFNIIHIHHIILRKLELEKKREVVEIKKELEKLEEEVKRPQSLIERLSSREKISQLQSEIEFIESGKKKEKYLQQIGPVIERYKLLGPAILKKSFETGSKFSEPDEERIRIIEEFTQIASLYFCVNLYRETGPISNFCLCNFDLSDVFIDENGMQVCPLCGNERFVCSYAYESDKSPSLRSDYDNGENFWKALQRFQGKQANKIPDTLFSFLDDYFSKRGLSAGEEIRRQPLNSRGRKDGTDLSLMYEALEKGKYYLYRDANLICHLYWGWTLPDLSHIEEQIMEDYHKTQKIYNQIEKTRSSSLGTQFRIFKHLQLRGYPCFIDDFKLVEMADSVEFHETTWKEMCEKSGDPDLYYIPTY